MNAKQVDWLRVVAEAEAQKKPGDVWTMPHGILHHAVATHCNGDFYNCVLAESLCTRVKVTGSARPGTPDCPDCLRALANAAQPAAWEVAEEEFRYLLGRRVSAVDRTVGFIMLNPSTASGVDARGREVNDPTVLRIKGWTERWGFGAVLIANKYARRSPHPEHLQKVDDPVGPKNDAFLLQVAQLAEIVVCAWGAPLRKWSEQRTARVLEILIAEAGVLPWVLGTTQDGDPKHPMARGLHRVPDHVTPKPMFRVPDIFRVKNRNTEGYYEMEGTLPTGRRCRVAVDPKRNGTISFRAAGVDQPLTAGEALFIQKLLQHQEDERASDNGWPPARVHLLGDAR
ncbi:MAG: DUF1643 domain-containing protein [Kofleriaceae bacterium]